MKCQLQFSSAFLLPLLLCSFALLHGCGGADSSTAAAGPESPVPVCAASQFRGVSTDQLAVEAHRQFQVPVLDYASTETPDGWALSLELMVDASGHVECYQMTDDYGQPREMNVQRRGLVLAMRDWRYKPFQDVNGEPTGAIVEERVREQQLPSQHMPSPDVPLDQVTISLYRSGCYGTCPDYGVNIHGDGRVVYEGGGFVDVEGRHTFKIPTSDVASLVEAVRSGDLWSMDESYRAGITDHPTYILKLKMGEDTRTIEDYVGSRVGMPMVISEFQGRVDKIGRIDQWVQLSTFAVDRLAEEGFEFGSSEAADILVRAIGNQDGTDEAAMLKLIELGAPLSGGKGTEYWAPAEAASALDWALVNRRGTLVEPLLQRGALETNGALDKTKLDQAFQDAIKGGRIAPVRRIWDYQAGGSRPSVSFNDSASDESGKVIRKNSPVTLLLSRHYYDKGWEGKQIAEWLAAKGCDLKARAANGDTLLHIAAEAGDVEFVRYLLAQGAEVSAPGEYGLPALGSAQDQDVALLLLQSGSTWQMDDKGAGFLRYAMDQHWARVLEFVKKQE